MLQDLRWSGRSSRRASSRSLSTPIFSISVVQRRIGIAADIDLAAPAGACAEQRVQRVVRVIGRRRPAQQVEVGVVFRRQDLGEKLRLGLRDQIRP